MKDKVLSILFGTVLGCLLLLLLVLPEQTASYSERRMLRQFPAPSVSGVLSGEWFTKVEAWLPDQFPLRERFRTAAKGIRLRLFRQKDYHGVYQVDGQLLSCEESTVKDGAGRFAGRMRRIGGANCSGANRYAALIPDKSWYLPDEDGHPKLDFAQVENRFRENLGENIHYVSIEKQLDFHAYYDTDLHWRQERIVPVAEELCAAMGAEMAEQRYRPERYAPFRGSYYARALRPEPEEILCLWSETLEKAWVDNLQQPEVHTVYDQNAFLDMDGYSVFLSGPSPWIDLWNREPAPHAKGRNLLLFRDSFGSSLAPLLLPAYERILLVDLRYLSESLLPRMLPDCQGWDVLFLYSAQLVNEGGNLR